MILVAHMTAVVDPGFPVGGGVDLVGGAMDPQGSYVLKILHVKMKASGPIGGVCRACPLDLPMLWSYHPNQFYVEI